jgi:hypothetical protein
MLNTQKIINDKVKHLSENKVNDNLKTPQNQQNQNPMIVNNFNIINKTTNMIIVKHDKDKNVFSFYDNSNNLIGSFSVLELFKYINKDDTFLIGTNTSTSKEIIEKYICVYKDDKIEIISHLDSPFTGNIDLMAGLYADIIKVEEKINSELVMMSDIQHIEKIKNNNTKFIYELLIRILKLSNLLIEQLETNPNYNRNLKDNLIRYSVGSLNKICKMTKDDILIKIMKIDTIDTKINKLEKIQENIQSQMVSLKTIIEQQNDNIKQLMKFNYSQNKVGGNKSSSKSESESESDTNTNTSKYTSTSTTNTNTSINTNSILSKLVKTQSDMNLSSTLNDKSIKSNKSIRTDKTKSLIGSYSITSTLNDDTISNKLNVTSDN